MQVTMDKDELDKYIINRAYTRCKNIIHNELDAIIKILMQNISYKPTKLIINTKLKGTQLIACLNINKDIYVHEWGFYDCGYWYPDDMELDVAYENFNGILKIE